MYEDYEIRKRTYGTPENIRIRKIYNQILNRPENYGMEDLFPTINDNVSAFALPMVNNQQWRQGWQKNMMPLSTAGQNTMPQLPLSTIPYLEDPAGSVYGDNRLYQSISYSEPIDWRRLGRAFYDEFSSSGDLMQLGAENYLDAVTIGGYGLINGIAGGNYAERKQNYYNQFPEGGWRQTAKNIDDVLYEYARGKAIGGIAKQIGKIF